MEEAKELLNEYSALCGRDDEKSKARKEEILSWLQVHGDEAVRSAAGRLIESNLNRMEQDVAVLRSRVDAETYRLLPLSYIAKRYFGRSASWLSQRLNGTPVRGKRYTLNDEQKRVFNQALQEISARIGSLHLD